jgi:hypothetical protein
LLSPVSTPTIETGLTSIDRNVAQLTWRVNSVPER